MPERSVRLDAADPSLPDRIFDEISRHQWMQRIDLGNGTVTPGKWENPLIRQAFDLVDFRGKRVLDVGTCNGKWAFEAERRGADEVVAIDNLRHVDYCYSGAFECAKRLLRSRVEYRPDVDVCEYREEETYDVVIFCGVYYHLRDPLRALANLRASLRTGGRMIVEGPVYDDKWQAYATFHYREPFLGDRTNWWVPSARALREWIESSFFEIEQSLCGGAPQRFWGRMKSTFRTRVLGKAPRTYRQVFVCRAVKRADPWWPTPYAPFDQWSVLEAE